ncbi:hypothetical protein SH580_03510 [Coraliomargarita algicola]|uniref:Uncharacterized protein n=1 Tax=Coraliomargarita algicola TaxID=3092156 RepID=A0ABZ0RPE9_9BACT|nr:hypothetical protein [Coraliomargarita sp. J2-16]WPJ96772.1 hypothetical protein SH580_03510 [Coraliomargarita sp. J2-16]
MKNTPFFIYILLLLATCVNGQKVLFDHQFDGASDVLLSRTYEDKSGLPWLVGGMDGSNFMYADGRTNTRGGAMLACRFRTGYYELTATIVENDTFLGIGFTSSDPLQGSYFIDSWGTFALRSSGDFEFWEGPGATVINDGGNVVDDYDVNEARVGRLRLVLEWDDETNRGTVTGYFKPEGGAEYQVDLDDQTAGVNSNTISPKDELTGVGLIFDGRTDGRYGAFQLSYLSRY